jgi:Helix-turn-helix domain
MAEPHEGQTKLIEADACAHLGLPPGALNRLLRKGIPIPYYQVGERMKYFLVSELDAWWEERHRPNGKTKKTA